MFDKPYSFQKLSTSKTFLNNPVEKTNYRFKAAQRTYFLTLEIFDFGLAAVKYCDVKDKDSRSAYKKIFNDYDAFRVIGTCLHIMLHYWKEHPFTSFAFYAVARDLNEMTDRNKKLKGKALQAYVEKYRKVRFRIYEEAMLNLFSPQYFTHVSDKKNDVYLLINKKQPDYRVMIQNTAAYLLENYDLLFNDDV